MALFKIPSGWVLLGRAESEPRFSAEPNCQNSISHPRVTRIFSFLGRTQLDSQTIPVARRGRTAPDQSRVTLESADPPSANAWAATCQGLLRLRLFVQIAT
jgi:hypothetical protein